MSKCIPILLYAVEACPVNLSLEKSLRFSVTRIPMPIFKTRSSSIVMECQNYFGFYTITTLIRKRKAAFLYKLLNLQNKLCKLFSFVAQKEINIVSHTELVIALLYASWQFLPRHIVHITSCLCSILSCFRFSFLFLYCQGKKSCSLPRKWMCSQSRDLVNFLGMSDKISLTVQDKDIGQTDEINNAADGQPATGHYHKK